METAPAAPGLSFWSTSSVLTLALILALLAALAAAAGLILQRNAKAHYRALFRAERALAASEELFRSLFQHMLNGVAYCRMLFEHGKPRDFIYLEVNDAFETLTGLKNVVGKRVSEVIPGIRESSPDLFEIYGRVASTGEPEKFETYIEALQMWFAISVYSPKAEHFVAVFDVITERKRVEAARARLASAVEQAAETIVITDAAGTIQYVNPAFEVVTGYSREEAVGANPRILKSGEHDQDFYREMWSTITAGRTWSGRLVNRKKDGSLYREESTISPVRDAAGSIVNYVAVKRDVSRELELEEQLRQAQKMESVGRLAGGVAHDFNNMLVAILGYTELAMGRIGRDTPAHRDLREVMKAAQRSADLTRNLLAFARKQIISPKVLDLNSTVAGTLAMLRRLIGENIELAFEPGGDLWTVRIDPSQVDQMLANLAVNAHDAISGAGKVTVKTSNVEFDDEFCADHPGFPRGQYVLLAVSDNGCGMDRETQAHLFEPFFTTKGPGKGTGLGLATVYGAVKQNDGFVDVESEPGEGTTVRIYLPRIAAELIQVVHDSAGSGPPTGSERVLLVEDEPAVLTLGQRMLESLGYTVLAADSPAQAIHLVREHPGEIQLVLTDVLLPAMHGRELVDRLLQLEPNLKCLFMSGYSADVASGGAILDRDVRFIQKPFQLAELAVAVRSALESAS